MASLQARSQLRSTHLLLRVNKFISFTAFIVLLGAGWVALSYLKAELSTKWQPGSDESSSEVLVNASAAAPRASEIETPEVKRLSTPVKLVYSCSTDHERYHISAHVPPRCDRSALSEEAALRRGLKPCPICMPE